MEPFCPAQPAKRLVSVSREWAACKASEKSSRLSVQLREKLPSVVSGLKDVQSLFWTGERQAFERNFTLKVTVIAISPFLTKDI